MHVKSGGENRAVIMYLKDFSHLHVVAKVLCWLLPVLGKHQPMST